MALQLNFHKEMMEKIESRERCKICDEREEAAAAEAGVTSSNINKDIQNTKKIL